jgi:hypothetical protein
LKFLFGWLEVVPRPVEDLLADRLLLLVVQVLEIRVLQAVIHRVPTIWVESDHLRQDVKCFWVGLSIFNDELITFGYNCSHFCFDLFGRLFIYFMAFWLPMYFMSSVVGDPRTAIILCT